MLFATYAVRTISGVAGVATDQILVGEIPEEAAGDVLVTTTNGGIIISSVSAGTTSVELFPSLLRLVLQPLLVLLLPSRETLVDMTHTSMESLLQSYPC